MLQVQARAEDQAVQLHEKLEAKRAATHAEKVRFLDSKFSLLSPTASKQHYSLCCSLTHSLSQSPNQPISYLMKACFGFVSVLSVWVASSGVLLKVAHGECL